jgi:hypothetical protein
LPIGNWNVGSVPAAFGPQHVHFWSLQQGQLLIVYQGVRNYDVVDPGSGSGVLSTGDCPASAPSPPIALAHAHLVSTSGPAQTGGGGTVITDAAPKYYQVHFHNAALTLPEPAASLLAGATLRLAPVTLQYDAARSSPLLAVWSCFCKASAQSWNLSVTRQCSGQLHAVLGLSRDSAAQIRTPLVWESSNWSFAGTRPLGCCGAAHQFGLPCISVEAVKV